MSAMQRVASCAMKSLAAYADSDEEEDEFQKRLVGGDSSSEDYKKIDAAKRRRTMSNVEIEKAQLPEAPDSSGDDEYNEAGRRSAEDDDGATARYSPKYSDDYEEQENDQSLVEPPPPARPRLLQSPSPISSRGSTPLPTKFAAASSAASLPPSQGLVAYEGAEDEDEYNHRRSLEIAELEIAKSWAISVPEKGNGSTGGEHSRATSEHSQRSGKSEGTDEIDVDELLERPLEAKTDSTQSSHVASPAGAISLEAVRIPPPPAEKCSEELQARFRQLIERKRNDNYNFNAHIQARTDFRNPSIYEKLIEHFGIDEIGTNFPKSVYDPHGFQPSDYYDEIAKAQRLVMEKGGDKNVKSKAGTIGAAVDEKKRKSKWDN